MRLRLRFATNRNAIGDKPIRGFGNGFSQVHPHDLRFGEVRLTTRAPGAVDASRLAERPK